MYGHRLITPLFFGPVLLKTLSGMIRPTSKAFDFGMHMWGAWSLFGVMFGFIFGAFFDDIMLWFVNGKGPVNFGAYHAQIYDEYPIYRFAFWVKFLMTLGNFYQAYYFAGKWDRYVEDQRFGTKDDNSSERIGDEDISISL